MYVQNKAAKKGYDVISVSAVARLYKKPERKRVIRAKPCIHSPFFETVVY